MNPFSTQFKLKQNGKLFNLMNWFVQYLSKYEVNPQIDRLVLLYECTKG